MRPAYGTLALIGASVLYTVAFVLPAANPYFDPVAPEYRPWPGHRVFLLGWHLLTEWEQDGPVFVWVRLVAVTGWMANPALWLAFGAALFRQWWWVRLFSGAGAALALSPLPFPKFADALAGQPGYWAWSGSAIVLFAAAYMRSRSAKGPGAL